nr:beta-1,6-N-acetylglucosaminyltransferase [Palleronia pontilimi]
MLCHDALERAAQIARHWAERDCPMVIHVDSRVSAARFRKFRDAVKDLDNVAFSPRVKCEWGGWSLVSATLKASEIMLREFPQAHHIYLASGTCLPLRSVSELKTYLAERADTSFIESVTTADVPWTKGGLDSERFTLRFPFSWKKQRFLFDAYVQLQRRLKFKRRIPYGIRPHMGSQWWCLTRRSLKAILEDPRRREFERYFQRVWIPDESYFQTLVRLHPGRVESRSLTLSKFDFQGKPHIFYDDHLQLLRRSDCFVARKIWPQADRLYTHFLSGDDNSTNLAEPNPGKIDRIFAKAIERRTRGRAGLYMVSRFPRAEYDNGRTCARYSIFEGFGDLFHDFPNWLHRATGVRAHGHLFGPDRAEFADGQRVYSGALSDNPRLRDYNCNAFLTNLLWNTRGERQAFLFGPRDTQDIAGFFAFDPNAEIKVVTGAWAVPLFQSDAPFSEIRREAARLQKIESAHLNLLRGPHVKARVSIWSMADFVEAPLEPLQGLVEDTGTWNARKLTEAPRMKELTGFGQFLQNLKNEGMNPYMMGDFPSGDGPDVEKPDIRKPYIVR